MATTHPTARPPLVNSAAERAGPRPEGPSGKAANPPAGAKLQVAQYLGLARATEEQLLNALTLVAERHEKNYELARGATTLALWCREHLTWMKALEEHYGAVPSEQPEMLRAALLGGTRAGIVGELADLCDLSVLAERAEMTWTILYQGGRELRDDALQDLAGRARDHNRRQINWMRTEIDHLAPDALSVPLDIAGQAKLAIPKRLDALASIPDWIWVPAATAVMMLVVGALGLAVGKPWLGPSLGPSAVVIAMTPSHPTARGWNTLMGHVGGLIMGFLAVLVVGAAAAPPVLETGVLTGPRVAAAVLALPLTVLAGILLRASHPPAAATTLLVALGSISTVDKAGAVVAGVAILALMGELLRRVRLERSTPSEKLAPKDSVARWRLRLS
jgi:hypothetical protein